MPEWISPAAVNTFFLAVFFCTVIWGIVRSAKFFEPLVRARFEKQTLKHEADAALADSLRVTTSQQTSLMERQTAMLNDQGSKLNEQGYRLDAQGRILDSHGHQLQTIARAIGAEIVVGIEQRAVAVFPAIEVDAENTPRVVGVIHETRQAPEPGDHSKGGG